jgi:hypothetical protein
LGLNAENSNTPEKPSGTDKQGALKIASEPHPAKPQTNKDQNIQPTSGVTDAGNLARLERKRKRAEAAAANGQTTGTSTVAENNSEISSEPPDLTAIKDSATEHTPISADSGIDSADGRTEAGNLARLERKRKRAEAAAANGQTTGTSTVAERNSEISTETPGLTAIKDSATEHNPISGDSGIASADGRTEAGNLARLERKRKRAEAAGAKPDSDKSGETVAGSEAGINQIKASENPEQPE